MIEDIGGAGLRSTVGYGGGGKGTGVGGVGVDEEAVVEMVCRRLVSV